MANSNFAGWTGDISSANNPLLFSINSDTALIANFALKTFELTSTVIGSGSITPPSQTIEFEGTASFTVEPATGWSLSSVTGDPCIPVNTGGTNWQTNSITADCVVEAVFTIASYTVTASSISGQGSITPASQNVDFGGSASFTLTPNTGWSTSLVAGDTCSPDSLGEGVWIAANITQACAVTASFARQATDLQIAKDNGVDTALDGQVLVYAITVANAGPLAVTAAQLADVLPASLVEAEWACLPEASNTPCPEAPFNAGSGDLYAEIDLPVDGFLRYDLSARVQANGGTLVSNTATVTTPPEVDELDSSNNSATDETLIVPEGIFASGFEVGPKALTVPAAAKAQRDAAGR